MNASSGRIREIFRSRGSSSVEKSPRRIRALGIAAAVWAVVLGICAVSARSQTPTTPVLVAGSSVDGCTLGIPRWKGYMSPTDPDKFWLSFANGGSSTSNMSYTTNGGTTWSTNAITIEGYMDFHLSLFGRDDDLFFTFPGVKFRRFAEPAESISDAGPLVTLAGTSGAHRANVMVQNNGRIWVFTRQGATASENVRYQYSDNSGSSWTSGVAYATGTPDVRIGSMPFVGGNPALVVLNLNSSRGYEYYLWNGSSFQSNPDHTIYAINPGYDRAFTHNQINDTIMHLVFGDGSNLRHVWKNYANGTGTWNTSVIMSNANNGSIDWLPITTVRGNDMYLFYCRLSSADVASRRVYYRKWSQTTRTWGAEYAIGNQAYSRDPNTCFHVPASADYIPMFYSAGTGSFSVYFSKIPVTPTATDTIAPDSIDDLGAMPADGSVILNWTSTGDDHSTGQADGYNLRYSLDPINESNWSSAIRLGNTPDPAPAGQAQSFTVSNLPFGTVYFAIKSVDDAENPSSISNLALVLVSDVDDADDDILLPDRTELAAVYPNPFNSETQIQYQVATASYLTLRIYNVLGQEVKVLVNGHKSSGRYQVFWDGTDDRGSPVASGVYFCRLTAGDYSDTRKLAYMK